MRVPFAIPVVLVACGTSAPSPPQNSAPSPPQTQTLAAPDRATLAAMSSDERCAAVAPRAKPCLDELMVAHTAQIDPALGEGMRENLANKPPASASELDVMHRAECAGDAAYPAAAVKCWTRPDCTQFATCVVTELEKPKPAQ